MTRSGAAFFTAILAACISTASAETYTWTDDQGTVHFTEDPGRVPIKFRKKVLSDEGPAPVPEEKGTPGATSAKPPEAVPQAPPIAEESDNGLYAGKTYGQWQKELAEREAAMEAVKKRIEEIAALRKNPAASREVRGKLIEEHKMLLAQFNEMKAEYFQQVEIARKAGLTINIQ